MISPNVTNASAPAGQHQRLRVDCIRPSTTNPRGDDFPPEEIAALAESIAAQGLLQAIVVRPVSGDSARFEIVVGECRWRAHQRLGAEWIDAVVREFSDDQALEAQHVENLQRHGLNPMAEARSYRAMLALRDERGGQRYTVEAMAERFGVSADYIYNRMKLTELPKAGQAALAKGDLGTRVAEMIARIPDATAQAAALKVALEKDREGGERPGAREMAVWVRDNCVRSLARAPWNLSDATLVPEAGSCLLCPHMVNGGAPGRGRRCLSPGCFDAKVEAQWARKTAEAVGAGKRVLTAEESAKIFPKELSDGAMAFNCGWVDLDEVPDATSLRNDVSVVESWRALVDSADRQLGGRVPRVLARDQRGAPRELVEKPVAINAIDAAGEPIFRERGAIKKAAVPDKFKEDKKAAAEHRAKRARELHAVLDRVHQVLAERGLDDVWLMVVSGLLTAEGKALLSEWRGWDLPADEAEAESVLTRCLDNLDRNDEAALVPILTMAHGVRQEGVDHQPLRTLCELLTIDIDEVLAEAEERDE